MHNGGVFNQPLQALISPSLFFFLQWLVFAMHPWLCGKSLHTNMQCCATTIVSASFGDIVFAPSSFLAFFFFLLLFSFFLFPCSLLLKPISHKFQLLHVLAAGVARRGRGLAFNRPGLILYCLKEGSFGRIRVKMRFWIYVSGCDRNFRGYFWSRSGIGMELPVSRTQLAFIRRAFYFIGLQIPKFAHCQSYDCGH